MAYIKLDSIIKEYTNGVRAIDEISLEVKEGEFFSLLGPSGCGKSTLLRTIAGLEQVSTGSILIGKRDVTHIEPGKRGIAMVFQDYALFPGMTVSENISYALRVQGKKKPQRQTTAIEFGTTLGLEKLMERRPSQLSGGQQQRVALARAMVARPGLLLLDEPLSNLDARMRLEARTFLKRYQNEAQMTTIFVTHDQAEALAMSDRIAILNEGKIQQVGTPQEVFDNPRTSFVAQFIGAIPMNLNRGKWKKSEDQVQFLGGSLFYSNPKEIHSTADEVLIGIRPEYIQWSSSIPVEKNFIPVSVQLVENMGATSVLHCCPINAPSEEIRVVVPTFEAPKVGAAGALTCASEHILLFDIETGVTLND